MRNGSHQGPDPGPLSQSHKPINYNAVLMSMAFCSAFFTLPADVATFATVIRGGAAGTGLQALLRVSSSAINVHGLAKGIC